MREIPQSLALTTGVHEMNPILDNIQNQLNKIFGSRSGEVKTADILSELDLSIIISNIQHKHPTFSADALCKLYLYKRIKGVSTYPELVKIIGGDAQKLCFQELPHKRTFNDFLRKIDKKLLDVIAELILRTATQNNVILDIKLVEEAKEKVIKDRDRNRRLLRDILKILKRLAYPHISIKIGRNATFTTKDLLDVLVWIAHNRDFSNNGSITVQDLFPDKKIPDGDTIMYHFKKLQSVDDIKLVFEKIFDIVYQYAVRECKWLRKRRFEIAIDIHKLPYYGKNSDTYVIKGEHQDGTTNFYAFLTCSIVVSGVRFILDAIPINCLDKMEHLLHRLIRRVKRKIHIERAYLDRGFDKVKLINVLKRNGIKFVMPKIKTPTVKAWMDKTEDCPSKVVRNFKIGTQDTAYANLILVDDNKGIKRAFITNDSIPEKLTHRLFKWYGKRWGIETSYRNIEIDFRPRTTTTNYQIRLFYFLFSVCIYNLWVLVNLIISLIKFGKIKEKPTITAKRFVMVLYLVDAG